LEQIALIKACQFPRDLAALFLGEFSCLKVRTYHFQDHLAEIVLIGDAV